VSAAADGTAALPGIAFASDTNTGIYRPGADQLAISTGGTGRLFVNAAGTIQTAAAGQIETVSSTGTLTLYGGSTNKGGGIRLAGGNIDADIRFYAQQFTATPQERARIDSSGRLLVGTSSARTKYANIFQTETVSGQSNYGFTTVFNADTSNGASIALGKSRGTTAGSNAIVGANDNLGSVQFVGADGTDLESAASIDAFVDSTPAYAATALVNGQTYRIVTVGSTDFTLIGASANTVGTIFTATGPGTGTGTAILNAGNMPGRLVFSTTADGASTPTERMRITSAGNVGINVTPSGAYKLEVVGNIYINGDTRLKSTYPIVDNVYSIGTASFRWAVVYAGTGTINTSDAKLKQDIENLEQAELNVAAAIKGLIKKFRFIDAVTEKGDDARIHVGVIAQEVEQAFVAENLDPRRYALFCEDTLEDGSKRLGIRYDELLAFVIAAL